MLHEITGDWVVFFDVFHGQDGHTSGNSTDHRRAPLARLAPDSLFRTSMARFGGSRLM